jgi:hypothetical protein
MGQKVISRMMLYSQKDDILTFFVKRKLDGLVFAGFRGQVC